MFDHEAYLLGRKGGGVKKGKGTKEDRKGQ